VTDLRREERFAFAVARRVLAATVEPSDIRGRQCAVDAMVHSDGRAAALEVSAIGPEDEAGILQYLASRRHCRSIAGLRRRWLVEVPRDFHPADVRKIEMALRWCDERGLKHLSELSGTDRDTDALLTQWVRADIVAKSGCAADCVESRVYFVLPVMGGFPRRGMASLPDELAEVLRTPTMQSKLDKLAATGLSERHLVLVVRPSAFSFAVYDGLAFGGPLPTERPCLPGSLSQIWLITGIRAGGVACGIAGSGWYRDHPYDDMRGVAA
jgi:hypothetical protein